MKKLIAILCLLGLINSIHNVFANQKPTVILHLSVPTQGEITAVTIQIIDFSFENNSSLQATIIFSPGFLIPAIINTETIMINDSKHPEQVEVNSSNNVKLDISYQSGNQLTIHFSLDAGIQNPAKETSGFVSIVLEKNNVILFSNVIDIEPPTNSISLKIPNKPKLVEGYFENEFLLELTSSEAASIFFQLDKQSFISYEKPILITSGKHSLSFYGRRKSGANEPFREEMFFVDAYAPLVKVISPIDKTWLNQKNQVLQIQIKDFSPVHFFIQNQDIALLSSMEGIIVDIPLLLGAGENQLAFKAIDQVGHLAQGRITYYVDLTPPALVIFSPKKGEVVCGSRVEISGKVELGATVYLFDKLIKTDDFGNFSLQILPPQKGLNQINLICKDPAGNETRVSYGYYYFPGKLFEFLIGQSKSKIDGVEKDINPAPLLDSQSGEVYVPLRFVSDALGFELNWSSKENRAVIKKAKIEIDLRPNESTIRIKIANKTEKIDLIYPPTLIKGSLMVPAEFLKKILGGEVIYELSNARMFVNFCDKVGNP